MRNSTRPAQGGVLLDFPIGMFLLFVGFFFPMLGLVTWGYRTLFVYYATRDACSAAARSPNFSSALANANQTWKKDLDTWGQMEESGGHQVSIVERSVADGTENIYLSRLTSYDTESNVYLIRFVATTRIAPLIASLKGGATWLNLRLPGFTEPFEFQTVHEEYVEDPDTLTN